LRLWAKSGSKSKPPWIPETTSGAGWYADRPYIAEWRRLWYGDVREALIGIEDLAEDLADLKSGYPNLARFAKATTEFATCIGNNRAIIPHYGERQRNDESRSLSGLGATYRI